VKKGDFERRTFQLIPIDDNGDEGQKKPDAKALQKRNNEGEKGADQKRGLEAPETFFDVIIHGFRLSGGCFFNQVLFFIV
jgi:hypothetical protein